MRRLGVRLLPIANRLRERDAANEHTSRRRRAGSAFVQGGLRNRMSHPVIDSCSNAVVLAVFVRQQRSALIRPIIQIASRR